MGEGDLKREIEEVFGTLTARQLWVLTKFAKRVRLRARNNAAYNNLCTRLFPHATFRQVTKEYNGRSYPGLQITVKDEVMTAADNDE